MLSYMSQDYKSAIMCCDEDYKSRHLIEWSVNPNASKSVEKSIKTSI